MATATNGVNAGEVSPFTLTAKSSAFVDICKSRKGQLIRLAYKSIASSTVKAEFRKAGVVLEKKSVGVFRTGVNFANLSAVKDGIESGERGEVQSLPKGQKWLVFPFVIGKEDGSQLLRITVAKGHYPTVAYFVNGLEVSKENYESYLIPSALKPKESDLQVFTIKEDNLLSVSETDLADNG